MNCDRNGTSAGILAPTPHPFACSRHFVEHKYYDSNSQSVASASGINVRCQSQLPSHTGRYDVTIKCLIYFRVNLRSLSLSLRWPKSAEK